MAEEGGASFRFKVKLEKLKLERVDGEEEDDFKSWALTKLTAQDGTAVHGMWYVESFEDGADKSTLLGKTSVTNGMEAAYNFTRNSPQIGLNDDSLGRLAGSTLQVAVFRGSARNSRDDTLIGTFAVDLKPLLHGKEIKGRYQLTAPTQSSGGESDAPERKVSAEYAGYAELHVSADHLVESYCRGSRLLLVQGVSLNTVPKSWLPACEGVEEGAEPTNEQLLASAANPEDPANSYRFVLAVKVPAGTGPRDVTGSAVAAGAGGDGGADGDGGAADEDGAAAGSGVEDDGLVTLRLEGGVLGLHEVTDEFGDAAAKTVATVDEDGDAEEKLGEEGKGVDEGDEGGAADGGDSRQFEWRVTWPSVASAYLSKSAVMQVTELVESGSALQASLTRVATVVDAEGVRRYMDEDLLSRGALEIPLDDLLSPGCTEANGEYTVRALPFTEADKAAAEAAAEERDSIAAAAAAAKGGGKGGKGGKAPAKGGKAPAKGGAKGGKGGKGGKDAADEEEPPPPKNAFEEITVAVAVSLSLDEPIVLRPPTPPAPKLRPSDIISSRPEPPSGPVGITASAEFREDVALIVHAIAEEYVSVCRSLRLTSDGGDRETRRRQLLHTLNTNGTYHSMKEKLKRSAVRIVRERFKRPAGSTDEQAAAAKDAFVSDLYTYLVGQAHRAMNRAFADAEAVLTTPGAKAGSAAGNLQGSAVEVLLSTGTIGQTLSTPLEQKEGEESDLDRFGRIAAESEFLGDFDRAEKCHQDRAAALESSVARGLRTQYDPVPWEEYAMYCLRRGDLGKALECLRQCLSIDDKRVSALLVTGALHSEQADFDRSVALLESAAELAGPGTADHALASVLLALTHESAGSAVESATSLKAAVESSRAAGLSLIKEGGPDEFETVVPPSEPYLQGAAYLLDLRLLGVAEAALGRAAACLADQDVPREVRVRLLTGESRLFYLRGGADTSLAEDRALAAIELDSNCKDAWELKGRIALQRDDSAGARTALELAVGDWDAGVVDPKLALTLASLYFDQGGSLLASSKEVFLRTAKSSGWAVAWLGAGKAALLCGEAVEAEAGLNEANVRDNHNAEVWAWLSLMCMTWEPVPREVEGMQALDQALKLGVSMSKCASLMEDISAAFSAVGKDQVAEKVLLRVVSATDKTRTRLALADTLARQAKHEESLKEYERVLADADDAADRSAAATGRSAALRALGRTA